MKKCKKLFTVMLVMGCFFVTNLTVLASEESFTEIPQTQIQIEGQNGTAVVPLSNPSLTACNLEVGIANNGLEISFVTSANQYADEIGVKNVVLQEKAWYGWKDIPVSSYYRNNSMLYSGGVVYTAAEAGKTYRVKCTHYAKFGNSELTLENISSEIVYN